MFLGSNKGARFLVNMDCKIVCIKNIEFGPNDSNNFQTFGVYFQAIGNIEMGRGTYIGPNVGLITANHDLNDLDRHMELNSIILGENC